MLGERSSNRRSQQMGKRRSVARVSEGLMRLTWVRITAGMLIDERFLDVWFDHYIIFGLIAVRMIPSRAAKARSRDRVIPRNRSQRTASHRRQENRRRRAHFPKIWVAVAAASLLCTQIVAASVLHREFVFFVAWYHWVWVPWKLLLLVVEYMLLPVASWTAVVGGHLMPEKTVVASLVLASLLLFLWFLNLKISLQKLHLDPLMNVHRREHI